MKKSLGATTIILPTPTWVIATYDARGKPNMMTAAWAGVCCSKPPCICVSLRAATYTHGNIKRRKAFTVNVPGQNYVAEADYAGLVSGRTRDKFADTGLNAVKSELVDAPYVAEFPLVLECRLLHVFELGLHTQFVGEIVDVKANEEILGEDGYPDIEKLKPIIFTPGATTYHGIGKYLGKGLSLGKERGFGAD